MWLKEMCEILNKNNIECHLDFGNIRFYKHSEITIEIDDSDDFSNGSFSLWTDSQDYILTSSHFQKIEINNKDIYEFSKNVINIINKEIHTDEISLRLDIYSFSPELTWIKSEDIYDYVDGKITYK